MKCIAFETEAVQHVSMNWFKIVEICSYHNIQSFCLKNKVSTKHALPIQYVICTLLKKSFISPQKKSQHIGTNMNGEYNS